VKTRWWPAIVTLIAGIAGFVWVWTSDGDRTGQERVYLSMAVVLGVLILLGLWLTLFSALPRRTRVRALVIILAVFALAAGTVRVRGVTGDLIPIFEWRWAARPAGLPDVLPPPEARSPAASPAPPVSAAPASPAPATPASDADRLHPSIVPERDYPQFLGPDRTGTVPPIAMATDWTKTPPTLVWRRRVGAGWSGFAVASGLAVTQEQRGAREMVVAYDVADGSPRWSHGDDARYDTTVAGEGPRATPTIDRGRVFTLGSTGILNAFELASGRRLWRRDIGVDNDSPMPDWGRSSSPLAVGDLVIVSAGSQDGRALVAYNRDSGEPVWRAGSDAASYSSPQLATLAGVQQVVMMHQTMVFGHDPATGRVLWEHVWPRIQPSVSQPLVLPGDRILFSAGYGIGSRLLQIAADGAGGLRASLVWESTRMKAKFTNLVVHDGFVYGLDDGVLVCLDPATGERRWKSGRYGHGQVILTGGVLIVQTEEGEIVLVEARPDELRELTRFTVFTRKTWNPPALAGHYLFVRNDVEAAVYALPLK
jgi:outer membrane protein assembly factor BamB